MAAATSANINPIDFGVSWSIITVAGVDSPGAIAIDGIRGFERETVWDKKRGKGTQGATLTLTTFPPAEGSIEFQLWLPEHFDQWAKFRTVLRYDPAKKPSGGADALDIYHPALADLGISRVVTHKISPIRHVGRNLYIVTVDLIEWLNPPKASVVQTTATSKPNSKENTPGTPANPFAEAQQEVAAALLENAATPYQ